MKLKTDERDSKKKSKRGFHFFRQVAIFITSLLSVDKYVGLLLDFRMFNRTSLLNLYCDSNFNSKIIPEFI